MECVKKGTAADLVRVRGLVLLPMGPEKEGRTLCGKIAQAPVLCRRVVNRAGLRQEGFFYRISGKIHGNSGQRPHEQTSGKELL